MNPAPTKSTSFSDPDPDPLLPPSFLDGFGVAVDLLHLPGGLFADVGDRAPLHLPREGEGNIDLLEIRDVKLSQLVMGIF